MQETENLGTLTPRNIEEPAARCNICGAGLNYIEYLLYGNRCLFCCDVKKNISIWNFLQNALLDFMIYRKVLKWASAKEVCPDCTAGMTIQVVDEKHNDYFSCPSCNGKGEFCPGRTKFLGYLGAVGAAYYEELNIKQKIELLKDL